ncbi:heavy metal translocating P-type ATPase metal-binding domain-containing protein [Herminiimonas sp. CN]|uniref:heavy metal translocating P-type ATPase metal-binding domain-containing protein n=1 Tax=Herminiimonas sp. CN TaxID=1349818 RepID=UPI0004735904|nr:heavy metal translocating P-type ATPase metal-binding domain-containing protein [Herminiimonas sp. CN]
MMLRTLSSMLAAIFNRPDAASPKIACFHCGELVRQKRAVPVVFDGVCRDVCCHGCAAILSTVEQLGQTEAYLARKQQLERPDA